MSTKNFWIGTAIWGVIAAFGLWYLLKCYPDLLRGIGFYAAGVAIAPLGLYLAVNRTKTLESQFDNEKKRRIGEEFSRSIELLGNDHAAARQGGIYALAFLAKESEERRSTIVKIIASYIRQTGQYVSPVVKEGADISGKVPMIAPDGMDIGAALSAIHDLSRNHDGKIDLSNSYLRTVGELSGAMLRGANLSDVVAVKCAFDKTAFFQANLVSAEFRGCDFTEAQFEGAEMVSAEFHDCNFTGAGFQGVELSNVKFYGKCNFQDVNLAGAELHEANLENVINLTQKQIRLAKGNRNTKFSSGSGLSYPRDWR